MDLELRDKVVVITGGAGAIGGAAAECFLQEGSLVIIGDCDRERGEHVVERLNRTFEGRIFFEHLDLLNEASTRRFARNIVEAHSGIDVIVNNAAVFYFEELTDWTSLDPLDEHYRVGLRGPVALVQECWRLSQRSRAGSIVNVSSIAGHVGEPKAVAYTTLKAAQKGFTVSCAVAMAAFGGWAVSISPGHTWTPVHQKRAAAQGLSREAYEQSQPNIQSTMFGRFLEPEEIGAWIVLAASRLGRPLTGQDLRVTQGIEPGGFNRGYKTAPSELE